MTKARDISSLIGSSGQIDNTKITLDANEIPNIDANKIATGSLGADRIPNLSADKITSGTFADARLSQSSVQQYASTFDDNKIVNDISTLALRQASDANRGAYNTNSQSVDVFQDDTGIDTTTNVTRNSVEEHVSTKEITYGTASYETGDRRSSYTVTVDDTNKYNGSLVNALDGSFGENTSNAWYFADNAVNDSRFIRFDLGSGNSKIYQGVKEYSNNPYEGGTTYGYWKIRGSNDGTNWDILKDTFEWVIGFGSAGGTQEWSNTTSYRYIELRGVSGTDSSSRWHTEFEFKVLPFTETFNSTGNFTGSTITAPSSVSEMGAIITYQDNAGTNALNTDIVLQLSADGGSNYSTATLTALPDFSTGIKMAKVNDLAVNAGTQLKYKINFANQASGSKEARIRGVSLQY